ncbi:MAG: hypothetical protein N2C13_01825 [Chloroflexota bacterium]
MTQKKSALSRRERRRAEDRRRRQLTAGGTVVAVVVFVGILIWAVQPKPITGINVPESLESPANADGTAWGPQNARVIIEEFSDFQ